MIQETQNNELFSDISTDQSATINGGHGCGCGNYKSSSYVSYGYGPGGYYYNVNGYNRPILYPYRHRSNYVRYYGRTYCN